MLIFLAALTFAIIIFALGCVTGEWKLARHIERMTRNTGHDHV